MRFPHKTLERGLFGEGYEVVIGVDEVGMACLAGPVTVCAVAIQPELFRRYDRKLTLMRDSKALLPHQRERYAARLMRTPYLSWRVASLPPETVDEMNIYQASREAMRTAIAALGITANAFVLVDGNKLIKGIGFPQRAVVDGDRKIWGIAAASIIAKVHRDRLMTEYALQYPGYGFETHKGYPTIMHRERLRRLGPCPLHRRSFSLT